MVVLQTPSLMLREMTVDDVPAVIDYCADPLVRRHMYWFQGRPAAIARAAQRACRERDRVARAEYIFVLCLLPTSTVVGRCFLQNAAATAHATIGWDLDRRYWGRGLATEAAQAVVNFAFTVCKVQEVHGYCDRGNRGSLRVMQKAGLQRQGNWWQELGLGFTYLRFQPVVHCQLARERWEDSSQ
ncbi:MAG: GNAT family N-acetyltransferase [Caldilineaceae bacterium]|nr:GNAT family N-acetyltransferase [Caldilineaceae bacterium]